MLLIKAPSGFVTRVLGAHTLVIDQSRGLQTPSEPNVTFVKVIKSKYHREEEYYERTYH